MHWLWIDSALWLSDICLFFFGCVCITMLLICAAYFDVVVCFTRRLPINMLEFGMFFSDTSMQFFKSMPCQWYFQFIQLENRAKMRLCCILFNWCVFIFFQNGVIIFFSTYFDEILKIFEKKNTCNNQQIQCELKKWKLAIDLWVEINVVWHGDQQTMTN